MTLLRTIFGRLSGRSRSSVLDGFILAGLAVLAVGLAVITLANAPPKASAPSPLATSTTAAQAALPQSTPSPEATQGRVVAAIPECGKGLEPSPYISRERAMDAAVEYATAAHGGRGALTGPRNIRAEYLTLGEMWDRLSYRGGSMLGEAAQRSMWLVTVEGETIGDPDDNGPRQVGPYHTMYGITVDPITGKANLLGRWPEPTWQPIAEEDISESDPPRCIERASFPSPDSFVLYVRGKTSILGRNSDPYPRYWALVRDVLARLRSVSASRECAQPEVDRLKAELTGLEVLYPEPGAYEGGLGRYTRAFISTEPLGPGPASPDVFLGTDDSYTTHMPAAAAWEVERLRQLMGVQHVEPPVAPSAEPLPTSAPQPEGSPSIAPDQVAIYNFLQAVALGEEARMRGYLSPDYDDPIPTGPTAYAIHWQLEEMSEGYGFHAPGTEHRSSYTYEVEYTDREHCPDREMHASLTVELRDGKWKISGLEIKPR